MSQPTGERSRRFAQAVRNIGTAVIEQSGGRHRGQRPAGPGGRAEVRQRGGEARPLCAESGPAGRTSGAAPARIVVVAGDVTRPADLELLRETTLRRMGAVDILVPVAELFRPAGLDECTPEMVAEIVCRQLPRCAADDPALERHLNSPASIVLATTSLTEEPRAGWCVSRRARRPLLVAGADPVRRAFASAEYASTASRRRRHEEPDRASAAERSPESASRATPHRPCCFWRATNPRDLPANSWSLASNQ